MATGIDNERLISTLAAIAHRPYMYVPMDSTAYELYLLMQGIRLGFFIAADEETFEIDIDTVLRRCFAESEDSIEKYCSLVKERLSASG